MATFLQVMMPEKKIVNRILSDVCAISIDPVKQCIIPPTSRAFFRLISHVEEGGIEVIWDKIKNNVTDRMFSEFSRFY